MLDSLLELLTSSPWTYALLFGIAAGDAVVPALPSEAAMIVGGLLAGAAGLTLGWVIAAGAFGALIGDSSSYALGRFTDACRFRRVRRKLRWARTQLEYRGAALLVAARFIPGGRTATTFTAGTVRYPWMTRFLPFTAFAALLWASFASLLGYFGGRVFEDNPWYAVGLAFAIAFGVIVASEAVRRVRER